MRSKRERAWATIQAMPIGEWISIRELATQAGLRPIEMAHYLSEARKKGLVERKQAKVPCGETWSTTSLWRRKP